MKPFNLEEYLKNPEKKVVTKSGLNVRIICTDRKDLNYSIVALIENQFTEEEGVLCYTREGKIFTGVLNDADLFFVPEKKEGWINIYENTLGQYEGRIVYDSEEDAKKHSTSNCLATVKIEWEQ